jgi:hypothetical protein
MGAFWDKATILKFSRLRVAHVIVFVCAFALTELGRYVYRPYAYRSGLSDFGIADTMGNSLGVITQIFCMLAVMHSNWRQGLRVIVFVVCGYTAYECAQVVLPKGTFDPQDIIATVVGGVLAVGILWLAKRLVGDRIVAGTTGERTDPGAA